jgi:hypothetical protein
MNKLENKNVEVRFEKTSEHSIKQGFRIFWNDKPESKWDTYAKRTKTYKRESKWASCWEEIVKSFNEKTTLNDISKIVGKYGVSYGFYLAG